MFRRLEKPVLFLFFALFVSATFFLTYLFQQTHREYTAARERHEQSVRSLKEAEAELRRKEIQLSRLQHDPAYIERTIRQRLGWARDGETLYRFEESDAPR